MSTRKFTKKKSNEGITFYICGNLRIQKQVKLYRLTINGTNTRILSFKKLTRAKEVGIYLINNFDMGANDNRLAENEKLLNYLRNLIDGKEVLS